MNVTRKLSIVTGLAAFLAMPLAVHAADATVQEAEQARNEIRNADAGQQKFLDGAAGYAVFPRVAKGWLVIGGAGGSGIVFEKGKAVGRTTLPQVTVGAQIGGQTYSEIIYFETAEAGYKDGVAVFTLARGGLMAEASVGGQKFTYDAIAG